MPAAAPPPTLGQMLSGASNFDFSRHFRNILKEARKMAAADRYEESSESFSEKGVVLRNKLHRSVYFARLRVLLDNFRQKDPALLESMRAKLLEDASSEELASLYTKIRENATQARMHMATGKYPVFTEPELAKATPLKDLPDDHPQIQFTPTYTEGLLEKEFAGMSVVFGGAPLETLGEENDKYTTKCSEIERLLRGEELKDDPFSREAIERTDLSFQEIDELRAAVSACIGAISAPPNSGAGSQSVLPTPRGGQSSVMPTPRGASGPASMPTPRPISLQTKGRPIAHPSLSGSLNSSGMQMALQRRSSLGSRSMQAARSGSGARTPVATPRGRAAQPQSQQQPHQQGRPQPPSIQVPTGGSNPSAPLSARSPASGTSLVSPKAAPFADRSRMATTPRGRSSSGWSKWAAA